MVANNRATTKACEHTGGAAACVHVCSMLTMHTGHGGDGGSDL